MQNHSSRRTSLLSSDVFCISTRFHLRILNREQHLLRNRSVIAQQSSQLIPFHVPSILGPISTYLFLSHIPGCLSMTFTYHTSLGVYRGPSHTTDIYIYIYICNAARRTNLFGGNLIPSFPFSPLILTSFSVATGDNGMRLCCFR